jgi:hypothetical protein
LANLKALYRHHYFVYLFDDFISITAMIAKSIKLVAMDRLARIRFPVEQSEVLSSMVHSELHCDIIQ